MILRRIEVRDLPEIIDLRGATRENPYSREALRQIGITEESAAAMLQTTHRGWLCEVDGRIAGFTMGDAATGELGVVAVLPQFEGKGIGSRLMERVEGWLFTRGWQEIWLWTSSDPQRRAFSFYLHRGWKVSEQKEGIVYMRKQRPDQPTAS